MGHPGIVNYRVTPWVPEDSPSIGNKTLHVFWNKTSYESTLHSRSTSTVAVYYRLTGAFLTKTDKRFFPMLVYSKVVIEKRDKPKTESDLRIYRCWIFNRNSPPSFKLLINKIKQFVFSSFADRNRTYFKEMKCLICHLLWQPWMKWNINHSVRIYFIHRFDYIVHKWNQVNLIFDTKYFQLVNFKRQPAG